MCGDIDGEQAEVIDDTHARDVHQGHRDTRQLDVGLCGLFTQ